MRLSFQTASINSYCPNRIQDSLALRGISEVFDGVLGYRPLKFFQVSQQPWGWFGCPDCSLNCRAEFREMGGIVRFQIKRLFFRPIFGHIQSETPLYQGNNQIRRRFP